MMMQRKWKIAALLAVTLLTGSVYASAAEYSLDNDFLSWLFDFQRTKGVKPVSDKQYQEECGACHFAYQPGLLPAKSWEALLNEKALRNHFGANAELDKDALKDIRDYAIRNSAGNSWYKQSRKIAVATENGPTPLRITDLHYISRKHHEIPEKMILGNKDVKSLSFCDKCHTQAAKGVYDADTVNIPHYPNWDGWFNK
jgi:nitrate reductase cytochrome c-type subunit